MDHAEKIINLVEQLNAAMKAAREDDIEITLEYSSCNPRAPSRGLITISRLAKNLLAARGVI